MIDKDGNVLKKEKPSSLQNDEILNIVRVADIGKRLIGVSSIGGRSVHILDETFKTVGSYSPKKPNEVVADFRLADLHGNGTPILLLGLLSQNGSGTASNDSLLAVDLQGRELWRDDTILSPFQVAAFFKENRLEIFATHAKPQQETLLRFDAEGKQLGELAAAGDPQIRWFACADLHGSGNSEIGVVLVSPADGRSQVAGLDEQGKILWSVPIPPGEHQTPIDQLAVGDVDGDGVADSIWIDPGLDPITIDGKVYKRLVAYLVRDMDGRLNINTHGNPAHPDFGTDPAIRGGGNGPAEVRLDLGLKDVGTGTGIDLLKHLFE
jgi:hypothetical protein